MRAWSLGDILSRDMPSKLSFQNIQQQNSNANTEAEPTHVLELCRNLRVRWMSLISILRICSEDIGYFMNIREHQCLNYSTESKY